MKRQGSDYIVGSHDAVTGRSPLAERQINGCSRRGAKTLSPTMDPRDLPPDRRLKTLKRWTPSDRTTSPTRKIHSTDDAKRSDCRILTRPKKGSQMTSQVGRQTTSTRQRVNGYAAPQRSAAEEEELVANGYNEEDDMTISVRDEVREVKVNPRSEDQRCKETYSQRSAIPPSPSAERQWRRAFQDEMTTTEALGSAEDEDEEMDEEEGDPSTALFLGDHPSPRASDRARKGAGQRSDLDTSHDSRRGVAERKVSACSAEVRFSGVFVVSLTSFKRLRMLRGEFRSLFPRNFLPSVRWVS